MIMLFFLMIGIFLIVVVIMLFFLHAFHDLLFLGRISQRFQQIDHHHIRIDGFLQRIRHPGIGFSSHIDKQITGRDLHNILGCWLITVQVDPVVQKHGHLRSGRIFPQNIHHPVILRKDRGDDLRCVFSRIYRKTCTKNTRHDHGASQNLFPDLHHSISSVFTFSYCFFCFLPLPLYGGEDSRIWDKKRPEKILFPLIIPHLYPRTIIYPPGCIRSSSVRLRSEGSCSTWRWSVPLPSRRAPGSLFPSA